jgi:hypothetical protein
MDPLVRALLPRAMPSLPRVPIAIEKRKVYFAFSFSDVMRVNCVRNAGKIGTRETKNYARAFYDRSIWEQRSITKDDGLKNLMRRGIEHSSVVCVLVGTDTWQSRWVRYEIARAVADRRGLLAVHVNPIAHHQRMAPDALGLNPLAVMAVGRDPNGRCYLYEREVVADANGALSWAWVRYDDFTDPVTLPLYMPDVDVGYLRPLSTVTAVYDFMENDGARNIGAWVDAAAGRQVGQDPEGFRRPRSRLPNA